MMSSLSFFLREIKYSLPIRPILVLKPYLEKDHSTFSSFIRKYEVSHYISGVLAVKPFLFFLYYSYTFLLTQSILEEVRLDIENSLSLILELFPVSEDYIADRYHSLYFNDLPFFITKREYRR